MLVPVYVIEGVLYGSASFETVEKLNIQLRRRIRDSAPVIVLPKTWLPSQEKCFSATYPLDVPCGLITCESEPEEGLRRVRCQSRSSLKYKTPIVKDLHSN